MSDEREYPDMEQPEAPEQPETPEPETSEVNSDGASDHVELPANSGPVDLTQSPGHLDEASKARKPNELEQLLQNLDKDLTKIDAMASDAGFQLESSIAKEEILHRADEFEQQSADKPAEETPYQRREREKREMIERQRAHREQQMAEREAYEDRLRREREELEAEQRRIREQREMEKKTAVEQAMARARAEREAKERARAEREAGWRDARSGERTDEDSNNDFSEE